VVERLTKMHQPPSRKTSAAYFIEVGIGGESAGRGGAESEVNSRYGGVGVGVPSIPKAAGKAQEAEK